MKDSTRRTASVFLLAAIIVFHVATNIVFIRADRRPANINELSHVIGAIDFLNLLVDQPDKHAAYLIAFSGYPPAGVVASAAYAILGRVHSSAQASQILFSVLGIAALWALGRKLFDEKTGLLAAAFFTLSPSVCEVSRQYLLEWPLTALTIVAVSMLWQSGGFKEKKYAYLAGLFVGLATLAKQTAFIFLAGPLLVSMGFWIRNLIRERGTPRLERTPRRILIAVAAIAAGPALAWLLYPQSTREAIDAWFTVGGMKPFAWGALFWGLTAALAISAALFANFGSGPAANATGSGLLAILVSSVWYFPKGIGNFLTYANQMEMNVRTMSPSSLMMFYYSHLTSYYLGTVPFVLMAPVSAAVLMTIIFRKRLMRHFYQAESGSFRLALLFVLAWLAIPAVAFFFINIQNEMNTVPLMPSIAILQALLISRLFLPYNKRRIAEMVSGVKPPVTARLIRTCAAGFGAVAVFLTLVSGLLTALVFPNMHGGYKRLPIADDDATVMKYFPRKMNTLNYLVPMPQDWHVEEMAGIIDREVKKEKPDVLSMDVNFYFSWNTFWYTFKLKNREVNVETQWDDDRDLLTDPRAKGHILGFDAIVYREPWKQVYESSKNDYIDYKNLWKTYEYLTDPPEEFRSLYAERRRYPLPDGTTAVLLLKKS